MIDGAFLFMVLVCFLLVIGMVLVLTHWFDGLEYRVNKSAEQCEYAATAAEQASEELRKFRRELDAIKKATGLK